MQNNERQEIYTRITGKIVAALEHGVRPWVKPWSGENAAGRGIGQDHCGANANSVCVLIDPDNLAAVHLIFGSDNSHLFLLD
jgi:antirestriction protein ArdC